MFAAPTPIPTPKPALPTTSAAPQRVLTHRQTYQVLSDFSRTDRIDLVKQGVPARLLTTLIEDMQTTQERLYAWLGIARATANRKVKADSLLNQDESERTLGLARLIGQVETVVAESGNPEGFAAAPWLAAWLQRPNAALGGRPPGDFVDTADGRALVSGLIAQMQSGAYA